MSEAAREVTPLHAVELPQARPPDGAGVLDALPIAVVELEDGASVRAANRLGLLWGAVREERLPAPLRRFVQAAIAGSGPPSADLHLPALPGQEWRRPVRARLSRIGPSRWVLSLEDRTAAEDVDTVRRDFMSGLGHELKTPVGALALLVEALVAASDDVGERERLLRRLQGEVRRLSGVVRDVLELARVQGSADASELQVCDAARLVTDAVASLQLAAREHQVTVRVVGPHSVPLRAHPDQVRDALRRLLDNAIAVSAPGQQVDVELRRHAGAVEVRVSDRGPGVPPAVRERVFERFFRLDAARSRRTGGSGIGLAVVKHVAERHGGAASVRARPGGGATFLLRLPAGPTEI